MSSSSKNTKTIIIGLSGPSSSGKTTLARLLREIYNISTPQRSISLFILHEDDFYKTDAEIPVVTTSSGRTLQDWDCPASLDFPLFESCLQHIHQHGTSPPALHSKEDQNSVGEKHVSHSTVSSHRSNAESWLSNLPSTSEDAAPLEIRICILDGFLLFPSPSPTPSIPNSITSLLDLKLFLRSTYHLTKSRREARSGYVTLEGFWQDPPGYVDEIVWPNYVKEHEWMFEGGDCDEGEIRREVVEKEGIVFGPGKGETPMTEVLEWAVGVMEREVERLVKE